MPGILIRLIRSRLAAAAVGAAMTAGVGGLAFAAIPGPNGLIVSCYDNATGRLRVIDPTSTSPKSTAFAHCAPTETKLEWNTRGPRGPAGPAGPAGPPGAAGTAPTTLPVGKTERGVWSAQLISGTGDWSRPMSQDAITLPTPLARQPLRPVVVPQGQSGGADCPGTLERPEAAPGVLCVYGGRSIGDLLVTGPGPGLPGFGTPVGIFGFFVNADTTPGDPILGGTWAVTSSCCLPPLNAGH